MKLRILIAAACIALAGCQTTGQTDAILTAKKVLTAAHTLHSGVAVTAGTAARLNLCVSTCAMRAADLIRRSETILVTADGLTDAAAITAKTGEALDLIQDAQKGLPQ